MTRLVYLSLLCLVLSLALIGTIFAQASSLKQIKLVLSVDEKVSFERVAITASTSGLRFAETSPTFYLHVQSNETQLHGVTSNWYKLAAKDDAENQTHLSTRQTLVKSNKTSVIKLHAPTNGFAAGHYKVVVDLGGGDRRVILFEVTKVFRDALLKPPQQRAPGFNLALRYLGGKIVKFQSQTQYRAWSIQNLIDGAPFYATWKATLSCQSCGWASRSYDPIQQAITFGFHQDRAAMIDLIQLDTRTWETIQTPKGIPKHIEIWVADSKNASFKRHAQARLHNLARAQYIQFPPVKAARVKLKILSVHSDFYAQLGEVKIFEAASVSATILHDADINIANPRLGGHLVYFTSQAPDHLVHTLFDGVLSRQTGWLSAPSYKHPASYLPQEFVLGFKGSASVHVDRVELYSMSGTKSPHKYQLYEYWPKKVALYVSQGSPFDGYRELKVVTLDKKSTAQVIPINARFRYLKIRLLENYGASFTSLGEIKVFASSPKRHQSALMHFLPNALRTSASTVKLQHKVIWPKKLISEKEPNNSVKTATQALGRTAIKGTLAPLTESDYYKITVPGKKPSSLSLIINSVPYIRTSFTLLSANGEVQYKQFDPSKQTQQHARLSWFVQPGQYLLRVRAEPSSMVLLWDTSGSMKGRTGHVKDAVRQFIERVKPDEKVNLIRFSRRQVEVLMKRFSSDRAKLKVAIRNKVFAQGGTPLYDAMKKAIHLLKRRKGNRAIILLSDGSDSESKTSHQEIIDLLARHKIRVFVVGLGEDLNRYLPSAASNGRMILKYFATQTNGAAYFTPKSEALPGIYQTIGEQIRQQPTYSIQARVSNTHGFLVLRETGERIPSMSAPARVHFIVDSSGSMKRKIKRRSMIAIAKQVLTQLIESLPDDVRLGLRVYGHRVREGRRGDCRDSQLLVPFRKNNKRQLLTRIKTIKALGTTPLAYSLKQLPRDLKKTSGQSLVILVTDGIEECRGNPIAVMKKIRAKRPDIKLNVVGFKLKQRRIVKVMRKLAKVGGGQFFHAQDSRALLRSLSKAMAVSFDVHDETGTIVAAGAINQGKISLPAGVYNLVIYRKGRELLIHNVKIVERKVTRVHLKKEGQEIGVKRISPKAVSRR